MKILFAITNINGTYADTYSFGLASIASVTRDKGHDYLITVINSQVDQANFYNLVRQFEPKIIGYTTVSSQFNFIKTISSHIRALKGPAIIQIAGGIHPTIFPECILEADALDGIFIGESELAFSDFLDKVAENSDFHDVKNFAYQKDGKLIKNHLYPLLTSLDSIPFPEREKYGYERFIKLNGYADFMFSRGCPYSCSYCSNHGIARVNNMKSNRPRYRSPESSVEEILQTRKRYQFQKIFIEDDIFGLDRKWAREFLSLYRQKVQLPFVCLLRVNIIDEELVQNLKSAGCVHISCGVESGNDHVRNTVMKRNITEDQIVKAYALFKKYKISSNSINIIGTPHETLDQIWDTIKLNRKINPTNTGVNIFYPYRGTQLGDYCFEQGLVDTEKYDSFSNERRESVLNFSPEYKRQLEYIHKNWSYLVYRTHPTKLVKLAVKNVISSRYPQVWNSLISLKGKLKKTLAY